MQHLNDSPIKVFINGFAICGPGFRSASELLHGLLSRRDMASEEMPGKDCFDSNFFHSSALQAEYTDPQLRLLLQLTYEALVEAGVKDFANLPTDSIGVYVGSSFGDFHRNVLAGDQPVTGYEHIGAAGTMLANCVSCHFGFNGPSMKIDSACSSSLQALDIACSDVKSGKIKMAIVAGSNLIIDPKNTTVYQQMNMVSTTTVQSACKPFSDLADGYVRQEAVAVLVLSNEQEVHNNGLATVAEILGHCALSGSGRSITTPNLATQEVLYRKTAAMAASQTHNCPPVRYVECHGTGTKVGDEIETLALSNIVNLLSGDGPLIYNKVKPPLLIGSVKSNVGHTEAASGLVSLIKVLLSLEEGIIPPNLHYSLEHRNQSCSGLNDGTLAVVEKPEPIEHDATAVVNSFGFGGAYVQVIIRGILNSQNDHNDNISNSLRDDTEPWKNINPLLGRNKKTASATSNDVSKKSFSAVVAPPNVNDNDFSTHAFTSPVKKLIQVFNKDMNSDMSSPPPVWLVFTGNGGVWPEMGFELYQNSHQYKETYNHCNTYLLKSWKCDSLQRLLVHQQQQAHNPTDRDDNGGPFQDIIDSSICLTALQICLINLLRKAHFTRENCVGYIGHSAGEMAAGYFDGCLTLEQTLDIAFLRAQAAAEVAKQQRGGMLAVSGLSKEAIEKIIFTSKLSIDIACHTGPEQITLSGLESALLNIKHEIISQYPYTRFSSVNTFGVAFHSRLIDKETLTTLEKNMDSSVFSSLAPKMRSDKWRSTCCDSSEVEGSIAGSMYYCIGFRKCVEFEKACHNVADNAIVIECGPSGLFRSVFTTGRERLYVPLLQRNENAIETFGAAYGHLFLQGVLLSDMTKWYTPRSAFPMPKERATREAFLMWDHSVCFSQFLQPHLTLNSNDYLNESCDKYWLDFEVDGKDGWLRQHRVNGQCLLPAAVCLYSIWKHCDLKMNQQCFLSDLKIHHSMDISTVSSLRLGVQFAGSVPLSSSSPVEYCNNQRAPAGIDRQVKVWTVSTSTPKLFATCLIVLQDNIDFEPPAATSFHDSLDIKALYHRLGRYSYDYDSDFQVISAINFDKTAATIHTSLPDAVPSNDDAIWSARKASILALEGMLQFVISQKTSQYGPCQLPVGINSVCFTQPLPLPTSIAGGGANFNVHLYNKDEVVLSCHDAIPKTFVKMAGVQLRQRSVSSLFQLADVKKLELLPISASDSNLLKGVQNIHYLKHTPHQFNEWGTRIRQLREVDSVSIKHDIIVSQMPGFSGLICSLQKEPGYAHVRGIQVLDHTDDHWDDALSFVVDQACQVFNHRDDLCCLFAREQASGDGRNGKFFLMEQDQLQHNTRPAVFFVHERRANMGFQRATDNTTRQQRFMGVEQPMEVTEGPPDDFKNLRIPFKSLCPPFSIDEKKFRTRLRQRQRCGSSVDDLNIELKEKTAPSPIPADLCFPSALRTWGENNITDWHFDGPMLGNFLTLVEGKKEWQLRTADGAIIYTTTQKQGETVYIPPGYIHQVKTNTAFSCGYGAMWEPAKPEERTELVAKNRNNILLTISPDNRSDLIDDLLPFVSLPKRRSSYLCRNRAITFLAEVAKRNAKMKGGTNQRDRQGFKRRRTKLTSRKKREQSKKNKQKFC